MDSSLPVAQEMILQVWPFWFHTYHLPLFYEPSCNIVIMLLFTSCFRTGVGRGAWTCSSAKLDSPPQRGRNPSSSAFQTGLASQRDQALMYQLHCVNTSRFGLGHRYQMLFNHKIAVKHSATGDLRALEENEMMLTSDRTPSTIHFSIRGEKLQELYPHGLFPLQKAYTSP